MGSMEKGIPMKKGVSYWHVPHVHIRYIQTLLVFCNVYIKASPGYDL